MNFIMNWSKHINVSY